jgi:nitric oxide reductase NorQ protein
VNARPHFASAAVADGPYYVAAANEVTVFEHCHHHGLPVMLKGPTGCGKTRFVEHMAWRLGRPLVTVSCHEDLTAADLLGRWLVRHDDTVWQDGPLTRAVREGALCYLDEVAEAREDTLVVVHPLIDHRRRVPLDKTGEEIPAAPGFQLVVSYNPGYQRALKELKPSTRQRFVTIELDFPDADRETRVVATEGRVTREVAARLVHFAARLRALRDRGLPEAPSTRLLVNAARLTASGLTLREAVDAAVIGALADDATLVAAMRDVAHAVFA